MSVHRIEAARPDPGPIEENYGPRLPWTKILIVGVGVAIVVGTLWIQHRQKISTLHKQLRVVHQQKLQPVREHYLTFKGALIKKLGQQIGARPSEIQNPKLSVDWLRNRQGLYLHIDASRATLDKALKVALSNATPDGVMPCLGTTASAIQGLVEKGAFLDRSWLATQLKDTSLMRLRVVDDELQRRIRRDLPVIKSMMESDWLMLVVHHRSSYDFRLWDLKKHQLLFDRRIEANARLIQAGNNARRTHAATPIAQKRLSECALGTEVKRQLDAQKSN